MVADTLLAVEPTAAVSDQGVYTFDYGDPARGAHCQMRPGIRSAPIHAGGRYRMSQPVCSFDRVIRRSCRNWRRLKRLCSLPARRTSSRSGVSVLSRRN
jgi:hypothetical protein